MLDTRNGLNIRLNRHEVRYAAMAGVERRINAIAKQRPAYHGVDGRSNEWQIDIIGCLGELAVSKALNLYWEAVSNEKLDSLPGDVEGYQVRSTRHQTGKLIVYETDKDDAPYILAVVNEPDVFLAGWLYGAEAKLAVEPKRGSTSNEFWVPQRMLRPMGELIQARSSGSDTPYS